MATLLQSRIKAGANVSSANLAFTNPVTAGSMLVCFPANEASVHTVTFTVADNVNAGNYNDDIDNGGAGNGSLGIFTKLNVASGTTTITVTASGQNFFAFVIQEWSGIATSNALDKTSNNANTSNTFSSGATATTTQAAELALGVAVNGNGGGTATAGTNIAWTLDQNDNALSTEWALLASTQAVTAQFGYSFSTAYQCQVATYKLAAAVVPNPGATWVNAFMGPGLQLPFNPTQFSGKFGGPGFPYATQNPPSGNIWGRHISHSRHRRN